MTATKVNTAAKDWLLGLLKGVAPGSNGGIFFADTQELLDICEYEGVTPLLWHQILVNDLKPSLPPGLTAKLQALSLQYAAVNMLRQQELQRLIKLFHCEGLDFLILKGEALAVTCYPQPHLRTRTDSDLLFSSKDAAEKAWQLLNLEGYQRFATLQGEFVGFQFPCQKTLVSGVSNNLDIHHKITNALWFAQRLDYVELKENSIGADYMGQPVSVLNPLYALIHACIHRTSNKSHETENRLIWLYDIHLLSGKLTLADWQKLLQICEEKNFAAIILEGLTSTAEAFGDNTPEIIVEHLAALANRQHAPIVNADSRLKHYLLDLSTHKGIKNNLRFLKEQLLPPPAYVTMKYGVKHKILLPWYYLKRVVDVIFKK